MRIPSDAQWKVSQDGDLFGHVVATKNMDFNRDGYMALARRALTLYSKGDSSNFGEVIACAADTTFLYTVTTTGVFQTQINSDSLPTTELTATGRPVIGIHSDICFFNGLPHVSGTTTVASWSGSVWTTVISSLTTGYPHPLCVSEHQNYLAVGSRNTMPLYDTSYSLITTLTVDLQYIFTTIRWRLNVIFGGTRNVLGGIAKVFVWNGSGAAAQQGLDMGADWVYSLCPYESTMAAITSAGQLLEYNASGFAELATLPVYHTSYSWISDAAVSSLVGRVCNRGMQALGSRIFINLDGTLYQRALEYPGKYLPNQPGGIWCFDRKVGLYHKAGYNFNTHLNLSPSTVASNNLVFGTAHQATTGDAVLCSGISGLSGITSGQIYFAIVESTLVIGLAISPVEALAGNKLLITGTPAAGDTFRFPRYESMGETMFNNPGPVLVITRPRPNLFYGSEIFFGGDALKEDLTSNPVLMSLGMGINRGYCITAKIPSSEIEDTFKKLIPFFDPHWLTTDQMIVKYRTRESFGMPTPLATGSLPVWASTTTFTVDPSKKDVALLSIGDEIEIVEGAGAGYLAHITNIDKSNTSSYVFTIDEALPVSAANTFDFVGMNWKKWKTVASTVAVGGDQSKTNTKGYAKLTLGESDSWVQFKIELRGYARSIRNMDVVNTPSTGQG